VPTLPEDPSFGKGRLTILATSKEPPTDPFSLLIGDTLHSLRSGLDNLAYALACAYTEPLPAKIAGNSEFPICGDEDRKGNTGVGSTLFRNGLPKIEGWDPKAREVVEGLQPYQRGNQFQSDPLWALHEFDRINKHRLLHPVVAFSENTGLSPFGCRNVAFGPGLIEPVHGPVTTDTLIGRAYGIHPVDPKAEIEVAFAPDLDVAFSESAPAAQGERVVETLSTIYDYIVGTVLPALTHYL
jgi:hypothetical protein